MENIYKMLLSKILTQLVPPADEKPHKEFDELRECENAAAAEALFNSASNHLQQPHLWHQLAGALSAEFQPHSSGGEPFEGAIKKGDLLEVKIGGPLPLGADWVEVVHLVFEKKGDEEITALQVHPCASPLEGATEHFFDSAATSTFIVCRQDCRVSAHYRGRKEVPNAESKDLLRNVRDKIIASAALIGMADIQWKALLNGLVGSEED